MTTWRQSCHEVVCLPDGTADECGHAETYTAGGAFVIPRGFNGSFKMTGNFGNDFMTVEPER
ncbi:MAG: hypothetical protein OXI95_16805 [bacterium]|nr:hypothetical protein [bacterium]